MRYKLKMKTTGKYIDISGQKFGRLTVIEISNWRPNDFEKKGRSADRHRKWLCRCDCGTQEVIVSGKSLRTGATQSCGCLIRETVSKTGKSCTRHGMHKSKTYYTWAGMIDRCHNPNSNAYSYYGGRGIIVCDRWRERFENFHEDMGTALHGLTLDRIDVNGNYCPENCRWATRKEQGRNRRNNHYETAFGKTMIITEWAETEDIDVNKISYCLRRGLSMEEIIQKYKSKELPRNTS